MVRKKIFTDLFDREIKVEDIVLNVWANNESYRMQGEGDPGVVQYRTAKVIKFCPQSIRIEYMQGKTLKDSSIYNTHNRIIVMTKNKEIVDTSDIDKEMEIKNAEIEVRNKTIKRLMKDLGTNAKYKKEADEEIENYIEKIEELESTIDKLIQDYKRFSLLDL